MKVYFSGAHSSGKSTLARYVASKYNLNFVSEVARKVLSDKELDINSLRYDIDLVNEYEQDVFERQLEEENKFKDNFVSDRSALDALAYAAQHSQNLYQLINSDYYKNYVNRLKEEKSIIFFVRPSKITLKSDGVRELLTWEGVLAIDAQIKLLLEMANLDYFQINTPNMQERIKTINSVLNLIK